MAGVRGSTGRQRRLHQTRESRERQWIVLGSLAVLALVVVVIAVGLVLTWYLPPRAHVLTVGSSDFNAQDIVNRAVYLVRANNQEAFRNPAEAGIASIENQEVLLQAGPALVGEVDDAAVREAIATRLGLTGDFTNEAYAEALGNFLSITGLSRTDFESIIRAGVIEDRLKERFEGEIPEAGDQFNLLLVRTNDRAKADAMVAAVRAGQDFHEAALEAGAASAEADVLDLGWFPPEAVDDRLIDVVAGLQPGEVTDPVNDQANIGYEVFYMEARTTDEPYHEEVRTQLVDLRVGDFLDEQKAALAPVQDLSDSERRWIVGKVQDAVLGGSPVSPSNDPIGVSLLGAGNIGSAVIAALEAGRERYAARAGRPLELRRVLVRDPARPREGVRPEQLTGDIADVLADEQTRIVVEIMGGEEPARTYMEAALTSGRHVVTANKEVIAKHGAALLALASEHGVRLLYEASVGGGIPVIAPLSRDLLANEVTAITAIINGTTNYMLTAMTQQGADYADVLAEAQRLGYAEPDPTADVEGIDASYKIAVLCGLAFNVDISPADVVRQGISTISARDIAYGLQLGYVIKLLARARLVDGEIEATVQPTLVGAQEPLAKVDGVLNAVQFEGDLVGRVVFEGPGAGQGPTTSSVLADVLDIAQDIATGRRPLAYATRRTLRVRPPEEHAARAYLRIGVKDQPGVLAAIAFALGNEGVSIASVIQFDPEVTGGDEGTAELVLTTHRAPGAALNRALDEIRQLDVVLGIGNVLPMEG